MATPWVDSVRTTGTLRIHRVRPMVGDWYQVTGAAIDEFNVISAREHLGVSLTDEPDQSNANVFVRTLNGQHTISYRGHIHQVNLPGNALAGQTSLISVGGKVETAQIFLPAAPGRHRRIRQVGRPVRLVIAFHELIHACGLSNSDHGDLAFHGTPSVTRARRASDDTVTVLSAGNYVHMPPLKISNETCWRILLNWVGLHL